MRIGFDARTIDWGGVGTYSRNLLLEFARSPEEFVVFCQDQKRDLVPDAPNFTYVSANVHPHSRSGRAVFARIVEQAGVHLLHVPSHRAPTPVGVPLVATIHDVIPLLYPRSVRNPVERLRYRRQLDRTLAEARCLITVSQISLSTLSAYAGVDPARVRVIHNGVSSQFRPVADPAVLEAARHRYGLPGHYAFWIGEFRPNKNVEFLLAAWDLVLQRLGRPLTLVLAGAQGEDFRSVQREATRRSLEGRVLFPGFIREADLAAVYSSAGVFVFPSLYEGFGLPPLEAMACGTPCVVSNSSALPEVTGRAAMMFNPTSVEQFVDCVGRVFEEPDLHEKLRREGLRQSSLFSWEKSAQETLEVYRRVLE